MVLKTILVFSILALCTLALPDARHERSRYYVVNSDGAYEYGRSADDGTFEKASSSRVGQQRGSFGYVDLDGRPVNLQYEADEGGFVPQGTHLPATHPDFEKAHALARRRGTFNDPLANPNADPSYGFTFQGEGLARSELTDATGTVRGSYSYVDEEGRTRSYTYKAGSGIGFVIEGDDLPQEPEADGSTPAATKLSSSTFHFPSVVNRHLSKTGPVRVQTYSALPSRQSSSGPVEVANVKSSLSSDGRHSFDFQTSSHSREEQQDANNYVVGSFAFTSDDDGQRHNVQYKASAETGFVVEGDHLPRGPAVPGAPSGIPTGNIVPVRETPFFDPLANTGTDASYDFNFQEDGQSRTEVSDADGTVRGSYTYVDDEGRTRTLKYRAGKGIGFMVEGDGVPVVEGPIPFSGVLTYSSTSVVTPSSSTLSLTSPHGVARSKALTPSSAADKFTLVDQNPTKIGTKSSNLQVDNIAPGAIIRQKFPATRSDPQDQLDGSNILHYVAPTHSRAESIDGKNNVIGNFVFTADDDGRRRTLHYSANAATGFVVSAEHLPTGPIVPGSPDGKPTGRIAPVAFKPFFDPLANPDNDASYNFSFNTDSYSRSETSDQNGNVQGSYTVVDEDGTRRTYQFRAGQGIGFEKKLVSLVRGLPNSKETS